MAKKGRSIATGAMKTRSHLFERIEEYIIKPIYWPLCSVTFGSNRFSDPLTSSQADEFPVAEKRLSKSLSRLQTRVGY